MSANIWFWIIYVLFGVVAIILQRPWGSTAPGYPWSPFGSWVVLFILVGIVGWGVFGPPIR